MTMNSYVADELANKVYHLTQALNQTQEIVKRLEIENATLKECLDDIQNDSRLVSIPL